MTLTGRLFLLVAVAMLPALVIQAYTELDLRRSREAETHDLALRQAELAASELDQIIGGVRNLLTTVAEVPAIRASDTAACVPFLYDLQVRLPHLLTIAALDLQGRVTCRQELPLPTELFADRPYFQQAIATGSFVIGEYTYGRVAKQAVLPLAMPLRDRGGRIIGVVAAALDLNWLADVLRSWPLPAGDSITIADRNGTIIAREPQPDQFVGTRIPATFTYLLTAPEPGAVDILSQDGTRRVLGYIPIERRPVPGLYVSAGLSSDHAFAAVDRATRRGLALIALGLVTALATAWVLGRGFFHRPMTALLSAASHWRAGDYGSRSGLAAARGEFAALGAALDHMAAEIGHREVERDQALATARESEARLLAVVESLPFEFWVIDRDGRHVLQNAVSRASWGDQIGLRPEETATPPALLEPWVASSRRALSGETVRDTQSWPAGASMRHMETIVAPIRESGRVLGAVGLNIDVTARHEAELRQKQLVRELNHRVLNMLATVVGMARLTLVDGRSLEEGRQVLSDRLHALASTYHLLAARNWQGALLKDIALNELASHATQVRIEVPEVLLAPQAAQVISMILHELAANAARHGAFSTREGRVALTGTVTETTSGPHLAISWIESAGPVIDELGPSGFGRSILEEIAAHQLKGTVELAFRPEGLTYCLIAPMVAVVA